jgi:hypothetical protein
MILLCRARTGLAPLAADGSGDGDGGLGVAGRART